jgi:hypothetical protein
VCINVPMHSHPNLSTQSDPHSCRRCCSNQAAQIERCSSAAHYSHIANSGVFSLFLSHLPLARCYLTRTPKPAYRIEATVHRKTPRLAGRSNLTVKCEILPPRLFRERTVVIVGVLHRQYVAVGSEVDDGKENDQTEASKVNNPWEPGKRIGSRYGVAETRQELERHDGGSVNSR